MKIATYNINNINSRRDVLLRWLEEARRDIVCLQEPKCEQNKFSEAQLKNAGYNAIRNMRDFTIHNPLARLRETGDLFQGVLGEGIDLEQSIQKAQATCPS